MSTLSPVPKVPRDGIIDLGTFRLQYEDGDFSGDGFGPNLAERIDVFDRGTIIGHRKGNDTFPTFKFTAHMTMITSSVGGTVWDRITKNAAGPYASLASTLGAFADWHTDDLTWSVLGLALGDDGDSICALKKCDFTIGVAESPGAANKFSISGTVLRPRESTYTLGTVV